MTGLVGGFGGALDCLVEPALLFPLGIGEVEHQTIKKVGMADEKAKIVISLGSLFGQLAPGGVGQVVSLSDAHLLLLLWWLW